MSAIRANRNERLSDLLIFVFVFLACVCVCVCVRISSTGAVVGTSSVVFVVYFWEIRWRAATTTGLRANNSPSDAATHSPFNRGHTQRRQLNFSRSEAGLLCRPVDGSIELTDGRTSHHRGFVCCRRFASFSNNRLLDAAKSNPAVICIPGKGFDRKRG